MMDQMLDDLRSTPPLPGEDRVFYASEEEQETLADRRANGIPLHASTLQQLKTIADELEVAYDL